MRHYQSKGIGDSYCVDVGDPFNGRLAAIWLPEETVVEVNLTANETWDPAISHEF